MNELKALPVEQFRLVLMHEFLDEEGRKVIIDEPYEMCYTSMRSNHANVSWTLCEIMDRFKYEVIRRYADMHHVPSAQPEPKEKRSYGEMVNICSTWIDKPRKD